MRALLVAMGIVAVALVLFGVVVEVAKWLVALGVLILLAAVLIGGIKGREVLRRRGRGVSP
jgi:hypothetical protein